MVFQVSKKGGELLFKNQKLKKMKEK